jgi:phosphopentomutase
MIREALRIVALQAEGLNMRQYERFIILVLDSVGIGEMPDASRWGDAGSDTLGHLLAGERPFLPNLQKLGLGNIRPFANLPAIPRPRGAFGKAAILSNGKDTTVGHWEIAGLVTPIPFPTYPAGFPERILGPFCRAIGRGILGNRPASGTEIIKELGEEHLRTGKPIIYTSADSVFQVAAHEEVIPLEELYRICEIARHLLDGPDRVDRVIARPFLGKPGSFHRTGNRKDFAIPPPASTLLDILKNQGLAVVGVGKVAAIFDNRGITESLPAHGNGECVDQTIAALGMIREGLIFTNLGDFDTLYGHRNDAAGYARELAAFDRRLPEIQDHMRQADCLIITADHGCDPTTPGTDHTREYAPLLVCGAGVRGGVELGTRESLADVGQTVAENFGLRLPNGQSYLRDLRPAGYG